LLLSRARRKAGNDWWNSRKRRWRVTARYLDKEKSACALLGPGVVADTQKWAIEWTRLSVKKVCKL
jgi:hypothetical protein